MIGRAVQRDTWVHVYDEKRRQVATIAVSQWSQDGLTGYTGATVNVRCGSWVHTFNGQGRQLSVTPAR